MLCQLLKRINYISDVFNSVIFPLSAKSRACLSTSSVTEFFFSFGKKLPDMVVYVLFSHFIDNILFEKGSFAWKVATIFFSFLLMVSTWPIEIPNTDVSSVDLFLIFIFEQLRTFAKTSVLSVFSLNLFMLLQQFLWMSMMGGNSRIPIVNRCSVKREVGVEWGSKVSFIVLGCWD